MPSDEKNLDRLAAHFFPASEHSRDHVLKFLDAVIRKPGTIGPPHPMILEPQKGMPIERIEQGWLAIKLR